MDPIVNESNRLLYQAFVTVSKKYSVIGEEYRSKALKNSSTIIANYPDEITDGYVLRGIRGVGGGTINRINEFIKTGDIKIYDYEYSRAAKRAREEEVNDKPGDKIIDVLVPGKTKYSKLIIFKKEYTLSRETEDYYVFS